MARPGRPRLPGVALGLVRPLECGGSVSHKRLPVALGWCRPRPHGRVGTGAGAARTVPGELTRGRPELLPGEARVVMEHGAARLGSGREHVQGSQRVRGHALPHTGCAACSDGVAWRGSRPGPFRGA